MTGWHIHRFFSFSGDMKDFKYYAPTEVAFGRDSEERIGELALKYGAHKVLVHYGGSSAVRSGLLDKVYGQSLRGIDIQ